MIQIIFATFLFAVVLFAVLVYIVWIERKDNDCTRLSAERGFNRCLRPIQGDDETNGEPIPCGKD